MGQAIDQCDRELGGILDVPPDRVPRQDADDLVVGLVSVEHLQASNHGCGERDVGPVDGPLGDDTDVEGIAIAPDGGWTEVCHPFGAVGPGDEAVEGGRDDEVC